MAGGRFEKRRHVVRPGHQQPGLAEDLAVAAFEPPFRPIVHPLPQILFAVGMKHSQARLGQGRVTRLHAPIAGRSRHVVVGGVLNEIAEIHGLEDDAAGGIKFVDAFHEKGTEAGEKVAGDHHLGTGRRIAPARQCRQPIGEGRQFGVELVQGAGLFQKPPPLRAELIHAAGPSHRAQNLLDLHQDVRHLDGRGDTLDQGHAVQAAPAVFLARD